MLQPRDFVLDGIEFEDCVDSHSPRTPEIIPSPRTAATITREMFGSNNFTINQAKTEGGDFRVNNTSLNGGGSEDREVKFSRVNGSRETQETVQTTTPKFARTVLHDRTISEEVFTEETIEETNFSDSYTPPTTDSYNTPKSVLNKGGNMTGTRIESKFQEVVQKPVSNVAQTPVKKTQAPVKSEDKWDTSEFVVTTVTTTETTSEMEENKAKSNIKTATQRSQPSSSNNVTVTKAPVKSEDKWESSKGSYTTVTAPVKSMDKWESSEGSYTTVTKTETTEKEKGSSGEGMDETRVKREYRVASEGTVGSEGSEGTGGTKGASRGPIRIGHTTDSTVHEEGFEELKEINFHGIRRQAHLGTDFGMAVVRKTSETEQLCSAEMEEKKTFVIRGVINPVDQQDMPFEEAIMRGIICPKTGTYVNTATGRSQPLATAMSDGLIKVGYDYNFMLM